MTNQVKVHGTDLSHHNPDPDFKRAKAAGLLFAYHKATEGASMVDEDYVRRRQAASAAALPFGAYHFARPDDNHKDATLEANKFFKVANPRAGDLVPVLDFEVDRVGQSEAWCKTFMAELMRLTMKAGLSGRPMHYGPDDFGKDYDYLRWVPRYNRDNRWPAVPWDIFQFSGGAPFPGTPSTFAGLGAVDLNYMRDGLSLSDFRLMQQVKRPAMQVLIGHVSMQFSDTAAQQRADAVKVFQRAKSKGLLWITGTEASPGGGNALTDILPEVARANGFRYFRPQADTDAWIAVRESIVKPGTWSTDYEQVIPHAKVLNKGPGPMWGPKGVVSVSFETRDEIGLGEVNIAAAHYLTKGKKKGPESVIAGVDHFAWNVKLADAIGEWAKEAGKGSALAFYGGDQNIPDREQDTFLGNPLTSIADEIGQWYNTGHGSIDVVASYDHDKRVEGKSWEVFPDNKFFLHGDHFYCEARYEIGTLK